MICENDFDAAYDIYGDMIYKIAFLYLGTVEDAEDIMQDVFVKLITKSPKFKNNEHQKAWIIRTTQNKCIDRLRSCERKNLNFEDFNFSAEDTDTDTKMDVINKIYKLPAHYKCTVILYYYYDYPVNEIAKTLKISTSSVKMRLKRGREILKIELEDYYNEAK